MARRLLLSFVVSAAAISACTDSTDAILPPPVAPPSALAGTWKARDVGGAVLPAVAYRLPADSDDPGVEDYRLDSAQLVLTNDGHYTSVRYITELYTLTPNDPASWRVRHRGRERDLGRYTLTADSLTLTSDWIQNVVVPGSVIPSADLLRLRPELKQIVGSPIVNIGFVRVP